MRAIELREHVGKSQKYLSALIGFVGVPVFVVSALVLVSGWAYWMWMAIQIGSFAMFLFGLLGPLGIIAALFGIWSLVFGLPLWMVMWLVERGE